METRLEGGSPAYVSAWRTVSCIVRLDYEDGENQDLNQSTEIKNAEEEADVVCMVD